MVSWAIVAIPEDRDPVWKYSSEKIPHMTLLFLGEQTEGADLPRIVQYIQHVAKTTLHPFGMIVQRRGTLGDEQADVLFFEKDKRNQYTITQARDYLLTDPEIKKLYDSVEQYPEWLPHLTMGYPKSPAKKDDREYPSFGYVSFDRIALWTDEFDGPTFQLEGREDYVEQPMVMNDTLEKFLEHHGVKGMHWGVRNDKGHEGEQATNRKIAKLDKKYDKSFSGMGGWVKVHNTIASKINPKLDALNAKPEYAGNLYDKPAVLKKYNQEYKRVLKASLDEAMDELGTNASGTKRFELSVYEEPNGDPDAMNFTWAGEIKNVKHADSSSDSFRITPKRNATGHVVDVIIEQVERTLSQSDVTEKFLEHYGVKGMHWGIRRSADIPAGEARAAQKKPGTKITTEGGKGAPAHEDAIRAAISKQLAKSSTTDALSNRELQDLVTRMNLEQQYSKLASSSVSPGRKFVNDLLINTAKQQATRIAAEQVSGLVDKQVKKRTS